MQDRLQMNDRILSCEKTERSSDGEEYTVEFETAGPVRFGFDETMEYGLYDIGRELELDTLLSAVLEARMKRQIIPYCAFTRRTESQISARLQDKFSAAGGYAGVWAPYVLPAAEKVVEYLIERGYAGDNAYCASYIKTCANKNVSGNYIAAELIKRGVERNVAAAAVADAGLDEEAACRRALEKKLDSVQVIPDENGRVPQKTRASLIRFLLARGFETGMAVDMVDDYLGGARN